MSEAGGLDKQWGEVPLQALASCTRDDDATGTAPSAGPSHKDGLPPQERSSDVARLLGLYRLVLRQADALPPFVVIPSRPRWGVIGRVCCLPRPTFGVPTMTVHHVTRGIDSLLRAYALREATEGLTEIEQRERDLAATFRKGLRPVPWKVITGLGVLTTLVIGRLAVHFIAESLANLVAFGSSLGSPFDENAQRQLAAMVGALGSVATLSQSSYGDVLERLGGATPAQLLVLGLGFMMAAYVIIRPLAASYRVKRAVFNLAAQRDSDIRQVPWSWHLPRSAGLYEVERVVFEKLNTPVPREFQLDVWAGVLGGVIAVWLLLGVTVGTLSDTPDARRLGVLWAGGTVVVFSLRLWLLRNLQHSRARNCDVWLAPAPIVLSHGEGVAEVREVQKTAAWSVGWLAGLWMLVPPIPVWFRLATEVRMLRRAQTLEARPAAGRALTSIKLRAAMSTIGFLLVPPVSVASHLWKLARAERALNRNAAAAAMLWAPALVAIGNLSMWIFWAKFWRDESAGLATIYGYGLLPAAVAFAMVIALVQREHNWVLRRVGTPLRYNVVNPGNAEIPPLPILPSLRSPSPLVSASECDTIPAESPPISRIRAVASVVITAATICVIALPVALWSSRPDRIQSVFVSNLYTGDCLRTPPNYTKSKSSQVDYWNNKPKPEQMDVVPCKTPHGAEVFFVGDAWRATHAGYPGDKAIHETSVQRCDREFVAYVGLPYDQSRLAYNYWGPSAASWGDGNRQVVCDAYDSTGADLTKSIQSSRQ